METENIIDNIKKTYFNGCNKYSSGPGGFSCVNFIKENYDGADDNIREAGLRNPLFRDTLCARCKNHENE